MMLSCKFFFKATERGRMKAVLLGHVKKLLKNLLKIASF